MVDPKVEAMAWLRYGKKMPIVLTEGGSWNSDVLGLSDQIMVEVEVKKTVSDLRNDFKHKQVKHHKYANALDIDESIPNYFYFFVPDKLCEEAVRQAEKNNPKIGVAVHTDTRLMLGRNVRIEKKAQRLRNGAPSPRQLQIALARMSSELCGTKYSLDVLHQQFGKFIESVTDNAAAVAAVAFGTLDVEQTQVSHELWAAALGRTMDGKQWGERSEDDQKFWLRIFWALQELNMATNRSWRHEAYRVKDKIRGPSSVTCSSGGPTVGT